MKASPLLRLLWGGIFTISTVGTHAQVQMNLDSVISYSAVPDSPNTPWVSATFTTDGSDVLLTLTGTANLTDPEKVKSFCLNFDDALDVSLLTAAYVSSSGSFVLPNFVTRDPLNPTDNMFKADGDGYFDARFDFDITDGTSRTFGAGDGVTYQLSYGAGDITADDFLFLSEPGGGQGMYHAAAHILSTGTDNGGSAWVGTIVPEPSTIALGTLGLAGLLVSRSRLRAHP